MLNAATFRLSAPAGQGRRRRRHLHARQVARQRVEHRRRRHDRRAGRSEPRGGVGALELRSASSALGQPQRRAAVRPEPPLADTAAGVWRRSCATGAFATTSRGSRARRSRRASPARSADVARGTNGTLRANYNGAADLARRTRRSIGSSTRAAFSIPPAGTFGNASRNMIIGPGSRLLNAQFSRDVRMGGNRAVDDPGEREQPAQHGQLRRDRHGRQLADLRPGPVGPAMRSMQLNLRFRFRSTLAQRITESAKELNCLNR